MRFFEKVGDEGFDGLVAENAFVHEIQLAIENGLRARGMSQADLAKALGVSQARVSQLLADNGKNLRARTIARIAHSLGRTAFVDFIEEAPEWTLADVSDESDGPRQDFSEWVETACRVLEDEEPGGGNTWPAPRLVWSKQAAAAA